MNNDEGRDRGRPDSIGEEAPSSSWSHTDASLLAIANAFLRRRWPVVGSIVGGAVLAVSIHVAVPAQYTSDMAFVPQMPDDGAGMVGGLASRFGLEGVTQRRPPEFYAAVMTTRPVLRSAVKAKYEIGVTDDSTVRQVDLIELYGGESGNREERTAQAMRRLRDAISVDSETDTGIVRVSVTTHRPNLSYAIADHLLQQVRSYITDTRQSQATMEKEFLAQRLEEAREELVEAEERLGTFLVQNRRYENSPELGFEHQRLQRRVQIHQDVVSSLSQSYEEAKIEEVRTTPMITVVEEPIPPSWPDESSFLFSLLLGMMAGAAIGGGWVVVTETARSARSETPDQYEEFRKLRAATISDLQAVIRAAKRRLSKLGSPEA